MDSVDIARQLWRQKKWLAVVLVVAALASTLVSYSVSLSPFGLHRRTLQVAAASSQILVDSPRSTLVDGASTEAFDALAARARIYGEYLSTLQARARIAAISGVSPASITTSGPFSPESGQVSYQNQTSASRAGEILEEGAQNRLVFTAQEGVPIISVNAQAATAATAIRLAHASFVTLREYIGNLEATHTQGKPAGNGASDVTVRQLGAPEGGTVGSSNSVMLMALAFAVIVGIGCTLILVLPRMVRRWRSLDHAEREGSTWDGYAAVAANGAPANGKAPSSAVDVVDAPLERSSARG
jgi:hypothetical protein